MFNILGIEIMLGTNYFLGFQIFRVLSYIYLGWNSVRIKFITSNTIKQDPFGIYVGFGSVEIYFYYIKLGSDFRVPSICPALVKRDVSFWAEGTNYFLNILSQAQCCIKRCCSKQ